MTVDIFLDNFWRYYLILEERFENSIRYVELNEDNLSTYSIDFVNQLQMIGSEIDVIMKSMSGFSSDDRKCISDYAPIILSDYSDIVNQEVKARDILRKPFKGWNTESTASSLPWWNAYNHVKHGRDGHFKEANLENTLCSLMALYMLEKMYFKKLADEGGLPDALKKESELFSISGWKTNSYYGSELLVSISGTAPTLTR